MSYNIQKKKRKAGPIFSIFTFDCLHSYSRRIKNLKHSIQNCAATLRKRLRKDLSLVKKFKNQLFTCEELIFVCFLQSLVTVYEYFAIVYLRYCRYFFQEWMGVIHSKFQLIPRLPSDFQCLDYHLRLLKIFRQLIPKNLIKRKKKNQHLDHLTPSSKYQQFNCLHL